MLEILGTAARAVHVLFGVVGLAAFWIPVFARKGADLHVRAGKVFVWCAYIVLGAAAIALAFRTTGLLLNGITPEDQPALFGFIVFLGYLTLVTWIVVRHGMALLRHKRDPASLATPFNVALAWLSVAASVALIAYALIMDPPTRLLMYALSPIGFLNGLGILRYMRSAPPSAREWWYEHMGAMLGAGIAFHTAFAVFGINQMFEINLAGWVAVIPWVAPAAIGVPATAIWTRYYRRKFGELA